MEYGLLSLIILVLDIVAIVKILGTPISGREKFLWILVILLLPVLGLLLWLMMSPRAKK